MPIKPWIDSEAVSFFHSPPMSAPTILSQMTVSRGSSESEKRMSALSTGIDLEKDLARSQSDENNQDVQDQAFEARTMSELNYMSCCKVDASCRFRVDLRILPVMALLYSFALIDRINLGVARTAGMGADLVRPLYCDFPT